MTTVPRRFLLLVGLLLLGGCQSYTPSPLDLNAHRAALGARDPFGAEVAAYALRLAAPSSQPIRFEATDGLSLPEAEAVALFFNPELRLARLRAEVARVGAAEAGRWEDPQLGIDGERIIESVEEPWVVGGLLNLTIPFSGRLGAERDQAKSEASAGELRALAEERRVLSELRAAWARWSASSERAALARQIVEELDSVIERAERLRAAGELDPVDERLLRIARASQKAKLQDDETDARVGAIEIKARLGLLPEAAVKLVPTLVPGTPATASDIAALVAHHPRVKMARAEYEVAERTLKLEVRKQYPDITLGGGFGSDEGSERILFGASLPLPLFNANRRAIAEAQASRQVALAAAQTEYEQMLAAASVARERFDAARVRLAFIEKELAPLADQQVADVRRLAQLGEFNTLVLLESLTTAHEAKREVLEARLNLALASHQLEALLEGGALSRDGDEKEMK